LELAERIGSQIAGAIANSRLFSELARTENAMRVSEQKYRTLVNESPDLIFVSRIDDFRLTEVNDRACYHYGYTREEFLAMEIFDVEVEPPLKDQVRSLYDSTPVGLVIEVYGTNKKRDGTTFPVHVRFSKLDDEFAIANVRDITDQRAAEEAQRRMTEETSVMAEIGKIVNSSLDMDEVYARFAVEVGKLIQFDRIVIRIIGEDQDTINLSYHAGLEVPGRQSNEASKMAGRNEIEKVLRTREPSLIQVDDESELGEFQSLVAPFTLGLRSFLNVPLFSKDNIIGVLLIRSLEPHAYTQRHVDRAVRVGSQIAGAIENAQLYAERTKLAEENRVLAEIGTIASSSLNMDEIYDRLMEKVGKPIPLDRISVNILDAANEVANPTYIAGTDVAGRRQGDIVQYVGTLTEEVARKRSPMMLDVDSELDLKDRLPGLLPAFCAGLRSFLAVPLIERNNVLGVLHIRSKDHNVYTQQHLDLAERIGNQIAGAIANAELYKQTRQAEEAERQRSLELDGLLKVSNILAQPGSFQDKASQVMGELARIAQAESAIFRVPDEGGLRRIGAKGPQPEATSLTPYEGNIPALAYSGKEMIVVNDYPSHHLAKADRVQRGIKSVLVAPILS